MSCSICNNEINKENAPIIAMGGYGYPRYICDECAEEIEIITSGQDPELIKAAINKIVKKMEGANLEDTVLLSSVCAILDGAKERLALIEKGEYDFSLDDAEEEALDEIPEELLESEEDKLIDKLEDEQKKSFDKVFNWVALGVMVAAILAGVLFIILR